MYVDPKRNADAGNLLWILPYCRPDLPRVIGAIVMFCINNTMALVIPLLSGAIVDRVIMQGHANELTRLCMMMIVFTIVRVGSRYGCQMWMERFGQNSIYRLVCDEYEKLHELDFTYFNHTRTGDIMSRMTSDTDAIRHALSWVSLQATDCVVMFVGALAMMVTIDWRLALALACVTPFIFLLTRGLSVHGRPLFFAIRNSLASMNSMVEENIEGNRVVKAFVREEYETGKFDEHNDDYMRRNMDQAYNSRKYMPWLDGLGFSLQLITLGLGGFLVINGHMTLGNLVTFNSYLWMIDSPVRQSGWLTNDWQRFNASCIKIRKLLTTQSRIQERPGGGAKTEHGDCPVAQASGTRTVAEGRIKGAIDFEHVDFAFPDDPGTPVLEDIDFHIPAGAKLGILGRRAQANQRWSTSSAVFTTPQPVACVSTASTRTTGLFPRYDRRSASSRRTRSCSPIPSAAISASERISSVNTMNGIFVAWPPSPVPTDSSVPCRKAMTPSSANVVSACQAGRSSV